MQDQTIWTRPLRSWGWVSSRINWRDVDHEQEDENRRGSKRKCDHRDQACGMIGLSATRRLRIKSRTDLVYCLDEPRCAAAYDRRVMLPEFKRRGLWEGDIVW